MRNVIKFQTTQQERPKSPGLFSFASTYADPLTPKQKEMIEACIKAYF